MSKSKNTKTRDDGLAEPGQPNVLPVPRREGEKIGRTLARAVFDPGSRHATLAMGYGSQLFSDQLKPDIVETTAALEDELARAGDGDLTTASRILTAQAITLDAMFTELARRSGNNLGQHFDACERYARLALKAQSSCRSTLEALARLHQPREQTVKHVHVNDGGQAVVADHFHAHARGAANEKPAEQSHATGATCERAALPRPDAEGIAVPVPSGQRKTAL
jgi:hypothetical protein